MSVSSKNAKRLMGLIKRSENSLNQHIKLKHPDLWTKLKDMEVNAAKEQLIEQANGLNTIEEVKSGEKSHRKSSLE